MPHTLTLYGEGGGVTWKTSELLWVARWLFAKTGKPVRWAATDLVGVEILHEDIAAGIIDFFPMIGSGKTIHALSAAIARGSWGPPAHIRPMGRYIPYRMADGTMRDFLIPAGVTAKLEDGREWTNDLSKVSGYFFEGPSTLGTALLGDHTTSGRKVAQETVGQWTEYSIDGQARNGDGIERFANPGQAHYGNAQQFILNLMTQMSALPVEMVCFSTHESKGQDQTTKATTLGPKVVGSAATDQLKPLLQDMFHIEVYKVPINGPDGKPTGGEEMIRLAWFVPHPSMDIPGLHWPATLRLSSMPGPDGGLSPTHQILKKWPHGYLNLSAGDRIVHYVEERARILAAGSSKLGEWAQKIRESKMVAAAPTAVAAPPTTNGPQPWVLLPAVPPQPVEAVAEAPAVAAVPPPPTA